MFLYRTYFKLTAPVNNFEDARNYLTDDDMSDYLNGDSDLEKSLVGIKLRITWILKDEDSGHIDLESPRELTQKELDSISEWVSGQNSDGLGEGFEQQNFANYPSEEYCYAHGGYCDEDGNDDFVMASFDWQTNEYKFELISEVN